MKESTFLVHYEKLLPTAPSRFLTSMRESFEAYQNMGWPSSKQEQWKYSGLEKLSKIDWQPHLPFKNISSVELSAVESQLRFYVDFARILFVNGSYIKQHSSDMGKNLQPTFEALFIEHKVEKHFVKDSLFHINSAFSESVYHLVLDSSMAKKNIVFFFYYSQAHKNQIYNNKIKVSLAKNCEANLSFVFFCAATFESMINVDIDVNLERGSQLKAEQINIGSSDAKILVRKRTIMQENSSLVGKSFVQGGSYSRFNDSVYLVGEHSEAFLSGAFQAEENEIIDLKPSVYHLAKNTQSRQKFHGLVNKNGQGIFVGKILIEKDCQNSSAALLNKNILLADESEIDTKPELEVYADNVKANHGATVGKLDENEIFYLVSRGLSREQAESLLKQGFLSQVMGSSPYFGER